MSIRHRDIIIPTADNSDPFENCKLDRRQYAEVLTAMTKHYSDGFVLAVNNDWGYGKTVFLKMWNQHLKNQGYSTLYFNAWENDFQDEVIIALLSELKEFEGKAKIQFKDVLIKSGAFFESVIPSIAKGLASKVVGEKAAGDIAEKTAEHIFGEVNKGLESFIRKKKGVEGFRNSLQRFVDEIDNENPLVFIIDELDRCRPDYAVRVLEQVKHLFSVPGIVFVISIDKDQLANSIKGVYGSESIDAQAYLRRFFDLEYSLPKPERTVYLDYLYSLFEFDVFYNDEFRLRSEDLRHEGDNFKSLAKFFFESRSASLRDMKRILGHVAVIIKTFNKDQFTFPAVILLLSVIRFYNAKLYNQIRNSKLEMQEFIELLEKYFGKPKDESQLRSLVFAIARAAVFYYNEIRSHYEYTGKKLFEYNKEEGTEKILYTSGIDQGEFENFAYYAFRNISYGSIKMSNLITRVELTKNIILEN